MEKVESWRFRWPSRRGPFADGVTTADSGSVGVHDTWDNLGFWIWWLPFVWLICKTLAADAANLAASRALAIAKSSSAYLFSSSSVLATPRGLLNYHKIN